MLLILPFFVFRTKNEHGVGLIYKLGESRTAPCQSKQKIIYMCLLHVSLRAEYQCLSYSLCLYYTFHYWYKTPQVYDTFIVFFLCVLLLKLVLYVYLLVHWIELFANSFDWFAIFFLKIRLSIIKKCTNAKILEQLCLLTKLLPLSKFKYRWDFYGGKHS